jgi:hypothetical protein
MRKKRAITLRTLFEMLAFFTAGLALLGTVDVLIFGRAIDAFRPTLTLPATVVAVGAETVETRLTKHGNHVMTQ